MNASLSDSTTYSPAERNFDRHIPGLFERLLKKLPEKKPPADSLQESVLKSHVKMTRRRLKETVIKRMELCSGIRKEAI
jgi:hypothetical protein